MSERYRNLLAFDCSGASCSAAVLRESEIVAERFDAMSRGQAEALLPMIEAVMLQARLGFRDLDAIVTTTGPGSFTGLRIGIAAARGLALASNKPTIGITAFDAIFRALPPDRRTASVAVVIDSRRGPVFTQLFTSDGRAARDPTSVEAAQFPSWLPTGPVFLAGDGVPSLEFLRDHPSITMPIMPDFIHARVLAFEGAKRSLDPAAPLRPLYLRAPDVTLPKPPP